MYCNRLHAWWSTQTRLATLLSSLIARRWVGLQTLWWFRLKRLIYWWDVRGLMLWLFIRPTGIYPLDFFSSGIQFYLLLSPWVGLQTLWWFRLKDLSIDEMLGAWCFGCLSGPTGCTCWISIAPVISFSYCWVLIFALSPCYIWFICSGRWSIDKLGGISCKPNIYVSWSTSELRVRLAPCKTS